MLWLHLLVLKTATVLASFFFFFNLFKAMSNTLPMWLWSPFLQEKVKLQSCWSTGWLDNGGMQILDLFYNFSWLFTGKSWVLVVTFDYLINWVENYQVSFHWIITLCDFKELLLPICSISMSYKIIFAFSPIAWLSFLSDSGSIINPHVLSVLIIAF